MQFQGIITKIMPAKKVNTQRGEDYVQTFELTYDQGQYPKKIAFEVFGTEKLNELRISLNEQLICQIDFDTSEYNGRLFNRVRCWKADRLQAQSVPVQQQAVQQTVFNPNQPTTVQQPAPVQQPQDEVLPF